MPRAPRSTPRPRRARAARPPRSAGRPDCRSRGSTRLALQLLPSGRSSLKHSNLRFVSLNRSARKGYCAAAMAERNLEIVRQVYECVDQRRWDGLAELLDPSVAQYGTVGGLEE